MLFDLPKDSFFALVTLIRQEHIHVIGGFKLCLNVLEIVFFLNLKFGDAIELRK